MAKYTPKINDRIIVRQDKGNYYSYAWSHYGIKYENKKGTITWMNKGKDVYIVFDDDEDQRERRIRKRWIQPIPNIKQLIKEAIKDG